ncbi:hypothetical protein HK100_000157 [Physocladia obscura]|uniref:tRNA-uridine aminocarboxypropyltransferase n=1 Tax=Physocladia obscura TaxID=109957 RepID=A0AAD5SYW3_9FUNG|nr:hypothetical protein HK100_000157 [Physocladia obscura]
MPPHVILGTMTFGSGGGGRISDSETMQSIIDTFKRYGHNEIDTARMYCDGTTEREISKLNTQNCVLHSKAYPFKPGDYSPESLKAQFKTSLDALNVDKIQVFYLHAPDHSVHFADTLAAVQELYLAGRFVEFGLSNFSAWQVMQIYSICATHDYVLPTIYQGIYNAFTRSVEKELFPCLRKLGIRFYAYNPLCGGLLSGHFNFDDGVESGARFDPNTTQGARYRTRYWNTTYFNAVELVKNAVAKHEGLTMVATSYRWLLHHSKIDQSLGDGVVVGVSSLKHAEENFAACDGGPLPEAVVSAIEEGFWKEYALPWDLVTDDRTSSDDFTDQEETDNGNASVSKLANLGDLYFFPGAVLRQRKEFAETDLGFGKLGTRRNSKIGTFSNKAAKLGANLCVVDCGPATSASGAVRTPNSRIQTSHLTPSASNKRFKCTRTPACKGRSWHQFCPICCSPFDPETPQVSLPLELLIYRHPSEKIGKTTSVHAKVLAPSNTTLIVDDCKDPAAIAARFINPTRVLLLFPSPVSYIVFILFRQTIDTRFLFKDAKPLAEISHDAFDSVLVLDGTWQQANAMFKCIKDIGFQPVTIGFPETQNPLAVPNSNHSHISDSEPATAEHITNDSTNSTETAALAEASATPVVKTLFWRFQNVGEHCLSTIEAIYYFYRDYFTCFEQQNVPEHVYDGRYDVLLYFFRIQYQIVQDFYRRKPDLKFTTKKKGAQSYIKYDG